MDLQVFLSLSFSLEVSLRRSHSCLSINAILPPSSLSRTRSKKGKNASLESNQRQEERSEQFQLSATISLCDLHTHKMKRADSWGFFFSFRFWEKSIGENFSHLDVACQIFRNKRTCVFNLAPSCIGTCSHFVGPAARRFRTLTLAAAIVCLSLAARNFAAAD